MSYFYTHAQGDILGYSSVEWISLSRESDIQEIINHKALTYIILLNEGCFLYFRVSVGDGYVVMAVCPTLFSIGLSPLKQELSFLFQDFRNILELLDEYLISVRYTR